MSAPTAERLRQTERYVRMLTEGAPRGTLLDVRYRMFEDRFTRRFLSIGDRWAPRRIAVLGQHTDVYVGCAPRLREGGKHRDLAQTALLWADCDDPEALVAAREFIPGASMIVGSGSEGHGHAYWALTRALEVEAVEEANRRLAEALGADMKCTDATRILRPPGTLNFKHDPPRPVELLWHTPIRHEPHDVLKRLPPREQGPEHARPAHRARQPGRANPTIVRGDGERPDPLQQIEPAEYIRLLTGRAPNEEGKVECPLHPDSKPSMHAYPTPEQGWTCYGCPTPDGKPLGGDIYTLASRLWGVPTRGRAFHDLQARLDEAFAIER